MKPIFFELWNAGLFNQVLSLELAVGLAHETKRPLVVHFFSHNLEKNIYISTPSTRCNDQRNNFTDRSFSNNPHLLDLIDIVQFPCIEERTNLSIHNLLYDRLWNYFV